MASVYFSHSQLGVLDVELGMDQIEWGYGLNVAVFPTYGGEVRQILSCYVDDLTAQGTFNSYQQMERFYSYFLKYAHIATQGRDPVDPVATAGWSSFNQEPMILQYPQRNWTLHIIPTAIPGMRYDTTINAPVWRLTAHVADESDDAEELKNLISGELIDKQIFSLEGKVGFKDDNPFSSPKTQYGQKFDAAETRKLWDEITDRYNKLIPSYLEGDFGNLTANIGAEPAFGSKTGARDDDAPSRDAQTKPATDRKK